ncbi:MAG: hypothetical protein ISR64_07385 [Deltaproteobacteria bacterium]|nr:hypothetical protein [Deltaproteobacteria bacterium]
MLQKSAQIMAAVVVMGFATAQAEEKAEESRSPGPAVEEPHHLAIGKGGYVKLAALLQGWMKVAHQEDTSSTFRVRRAEIKVKGEIVKDLFGFGVMIDPAKLLEQDEEKVILLDGDDNPVVDADGNPVTIRNHKHAGSILQDLWVSVLTEYADISIGQFKIPVSWEGLNSSSKLIFAERSVVSGAHAPDGLLPKDHFKGYGDRRGLGIKVEKKFHYVGYFVGLYNGAERNRLDFDNFKDLAARIEGYPYPGITIGAMAYMTLRDKQGQANAKDRWEGDIRIAIDPVIFQAEYIRGRDHDDTGKGRTGQGFYATLAWNIIPEVQVKARGGGFDYDVSSGKNALWEAATGLTCFFDKYDANLKLDYYMYKSTDSSKNVEHQVIFAAQAHF